MARAYTVAPIAWEDIGTHEFSDEANRALHNHSIIFTIKKNGRPIGFMFCYSIHPTKRVGLIVEVMEWCQGVSPRDKLEASCFFGREMCREIPMFGFVRKRDLRFFEAIAKRKVLRRVGNSFEAFPGEIASVWETVRENRTTKRASSVPNPRGMGTGLGARVLS
jgi:hypothetical protein